jgi:hypothetical protein
LNQVNRHLQAALDYAGLGYPVFPCVAGRKEPLTEHGHQDATTDAEQIERWWLERPAANVGIATGGLLILDVDADANWLADDHDRLIELAAAPMSLTANGGRQYIYRMSGMERKVSEEAKKTATLDSERKCPLARRNSISQTTFSL